MRIVRRVGVAVAVVGLGVGGWLAFGPPPAPEVDPAVAAEVLPIVDEELERGPWGGLLESERPELRPRWFCTTVVIEIRRSDDELAVGVDTACDEYARLGSELLVGSGQSGPKVVVLDADGYRVDRVASPPDGPGYSRWVRAGFTAGGAAELDRRVPDGDEAAAEARRAFGLPADAPVRMA